MKDPIEVPIKRRKPRVLITTRQRRKLENRKRALLEAQQEILWNNSPAAPEVFPHSPDTMPPVGQLIDIYIGTQPLLAKATISERRRGLNALARYVGPRPLSRELVEQWNTALLASDYKPSGKWIIGNNVSMFLGWLFDTKRIPDDWRKGIRFPKQPPQEPREVYTREEYETLVKAAGDRPLAFVLKLGWATGMALVDCCHLTWGEVDMERFVITRKRQKTKVEAQIPFTAGGELHEALKKQQADTIAAFGSIQPGFPVCRGAGSKKSVQNMFKALLQKCGIEGKTFHSFRSTMMTDLNNSSVPLKSALKIVGVKSHRQFLDYASVKPEDTRKHLGGIR